MCKCTIFFLSLHLCLHMCAAYTLLYIMTMTTRRISIIFNFLGHYKYLIVVVLGCIMVGFVDDNSMLRRLQLQMQIADLQEEIEKYRSMNDADTKQLRDLQRDSRAVEKIARERYFMKADDEDIFVLSDDLSPETETEK
jgi:cell division protein DivIC